MKPFLTPRLALLALAHFTSDAYSSFFSPLLPLLVVKLHLSLTLVGTLVALASVSSSFGQPLYGYISDRLHRPYFVAFGPLIAALFMSSIGLASACWWRSSCSAAWAWPRSIRRPPCSRAKCRRAAPWRCRCS
jgi:MFS family permease